MAAIKNGLVLIVNLFFFLCYVIGRFLSVLPIPSLSVFVGVEASCQPSNSVAYGFLLDEFKQGPTVH